LAHLSDYCSVVTMVGLTDSHSAEHLVRHWAGPSAASWVSWKEKQKAVLRVFPTAGSKDASTVALTARMLDLQMAASSAENWVSTTVLQKVLCSVARTVCQTVASWVHLSDCCLVESTVVQRAMPLAAHSVYYSAEHWAALMVENLVGSLAARMAVLMDVPME